MLVNGHCKEAFNLFIQNEEIRNEFFLLQRDAKSAQKIERMSHLFTQISQRLQNLSTQFSLLDMTSSTGQENFDSLKIALAQFLTYHNQVNDLLAGKQISIDNELDTSAVEIEIIPDTSKDEQIAQEINLEENMALMPELRQRKWPIAVQQESQNIIQHIPQPKKSKRPKKRKFEALEGNKEDSTLFTPNKLPKHNEIVHNEIVNNIEDTIQMQPADENGSYLALDLADLPAEIWAEIITTQMINVFFDEIRSAQKTTLTDENGNSTDYTMHGFIKDFAQNFLVPLNQTCKFFHDITKTLLERLKAYSAS